MKPGFIKRLILLMAVMAVLAAYALSCLADSGEPSVDAVPDEVQSEKEAAPAEADEVPAADTSYQFPVSDGAIENYPIMYSSDIIRMKLEALRDVYPQGYPWNLSVLYGGGNGCTAFAFKVSDLLFDDLPYSHTVNNGTYSYDDIHVGDFMWKYYSDGHVVVILEKYDDHVVLVEGNYMQKVNWGRVLTKQQLLNDFRAWWSRYPDHLSGDVDGDKCIDGYDAVGLLRCLVNADLTGVDTEAANIDGDDSISPADAAGILKLNAIKQDGMLWRVPE